MKKLLLFCTASLFLSGCTTVPIVAKFPEAPEVLLIPCDKLELIEKDKVLFSEFLTTVVGNYTKYHGCSMQNEAWKEWYKQQKEIFENVSK